MPETSSNGSIGRLIASALAGAWRPDPAAWEGSPEKLGRITPLLVGSGAGALVWRRVCNSSSHSTPAALQLHEAYRYYYIHSSADEQKITDAYTLLYSAGIDSILIKGWAIARLYPDRGLRPLGDIDLYVRPEQLAAARSSLESTRDKYWVDLDHTAVAKLESRSFDQLYDRSQLVDLRGGKVRILGLEDHLRILCLHLLKHSAWRPLWLCDIAVALESRPVDFDWDRLLGTNRRLADYVACAIGLAHEILGARVDDTPPAVKAKKLPRWLVSSVLENWQKPALEHATPPELIMTSLRHPGRVTKALRRRWPDPIIATLRAKGPFNEMPRLPFQLWDFLVRTRRVVTQLPQLFREQ